MTAVAQPLTPHEARGLTDRIRQAADHTCTLLLRAHEGLAWKALGYLSWRDYATAEFALSQSRVYQLLNQARVIREIDAVGDSTVVEIPSERQARELLRLPEGRRAEVWQQAVDLSAGRPTAAAVRDAAEQIVDAEVVDEPVPTPPRTQETPVVPARTNRRPLPQAMTAATRDLTKAAERLVRLTADDRFDRNKKAAHDRMPELLAAVTGTVTAVQAMDLSAADTTTEARRGWATSLRNLSDALSGVAASLTKEQ